MIRKGFAEELVVKPFGENSVPEDKWPPGRGGKHARQRGRKVVWEKESQVLFLVLLLHLCKFKWFHFYSA